jgi:hypothetical protein
MGMVRAATAGLRRARARASLERAQGCRGQWLRSLLLFTCQTPHVYCWHAELGAGGKDHRADFVHAPFPKILSSRDALGPKSPNQKVLS